MIAEHEAVEGKASGNLFLDALPAGAKAALLSHLTALDMPPRFKCGEKHVPVRRVFFPATSVVSVVARMRGGDVHEIGLVGREGVVSAVEILFRGPTLYESFAQIEGSALAMPAADFAAALEHHPEVRDALLRYAHATYVSAAQAAACNGSHSLYDRCARWLLMAHDRVAGDTIYLTQEFLAQMLNVRRPGVTESAKHLQQSGAISQARGKFVVVDRPLLERLACECYETMGANAAIVLGYDVRKSAARS